MTIMTRRPPARTLDKDGREVLLVPLANTSATAKVFPEDFQRLMDAGFSPNWCLNCGAVKVGDWRNGVQRLCRLIAQPQGTVRVSMKDKDPLNLRSDNLQVKPYVARKVSSGTPA